MKKIGRYQLTKMLHQGDGATIYLAYDPIFECDVAIKVIQLDGLPHDSNKFRQQVEAEAKAIMSLEHAPRGIVPLRDMRLEQNQLSLVMPILSGGTLAERIRAQPPFSFNEAIQLIGQLAPALAFAHAQGIIHRNLKPTNVLFDEQSQPYLSDFALPSLQCYLGFSHFVFSAYSSPELACHTPSIDQRSDVYALGVMLFEMLTGSLPYQANQPLGVAYKHLYNPIPTPSTWQSNLPAKCDQIIRKAMAKAPAARYHTVNEFNQALNAIIAEQEAGKFYPSIPLIPSETAGPSPSAYANNRRETLRENSPSPMSLKSLLMRLRTWPAVGTLALLLAILLLLLLNMEYIFGIMLRSYLP